MRLFPISVILLLAWGALAVGGSPSWAGAPIAVFAIATGILGFLERRERAPTESAAPSPPHRPVIVALCLFLTAIGVQLVPLPASVVTRLSPSHDVAEFERLLATADRRDPERLPMVAAKTPRPLSIAPARTWWGLGFASAFALYLIGASHALSSISAPRLVRLVVIVGIVVAVIGVYQGTSQTSALYGLYYPVNAGGRSGPFINKNHQAGWLVMVLSLTLGLIAGVVALGMRGVVPRWRDRVLWFSSTQGNVAVLLGFAAVTMAIGILTTQSRSGAIALVLALTVLALLSGRRQPSNAKRRVAFTSLVAVGLIALFTSGSAVMSRLAGTAWGGEDRLAVWLDSWRILREFSLTGTGFNTYGVAMLHYQTVSDGFKFIEAHNDYLQLAVEGGWLLGIPAVLLIASLALEIRRRFREGKDDTRTYWARVGAVTGLLAIAFQSLVEFTLQMPGAAAMFATLLAIAIHHPHPRASNPERRAE